MAATIGMSVVAREACPIRFGSSATKLTGTRIDNVSSPYTISGLTKDKASYFVVTASNGSGDFRTGNSRDSRRSFPA